KKADIIRESTRRNLKTGWLRHDNGLLTVRTQNPHLRKVHSLPTPMIYNSKLDEGHGQLLHHDVLEHSHKGEFVTNFKTNVIAEKRVKQFKFFVGVFRFCHLISCTSRALRSFWGLDRRACSTTPTSPRGTIPMDRSLHSGGTARVMSDKLQ